MAKLDVIRESHVFRGLNSEQLDKVASISREETYPTGSYIIKEGEQAQTLYVIEDGKIELQMKVAPSSAQHTASQATVDVITKGITFGWSAIGKPHTYIGSALTRDTCKVIAIDGSKLLELMDSNHSIGYEVMKRFSEMISYRLVLTRQMLLSERGLALLHQVYGY